MWRCGSRARTSKKSNSARSPITREPTMSSCPHRVVNGVSVFFFLNRPGFRRGRAIAFRRSTSRRSKRSVANITADGGDVDDIERAYKIDSQWRCSSPGRQSNGNILPIVVSDSRVDRVHFPVGAVASVENLNDSFLSRWTLPNIAALPFLCYPTLQFARLAIVIINQGAAGFAVWVKKCIHEAGRALRRFLPKA